VGTRNEAGWGLGMRLGGDMGTRLPPDSILHERFFTFHFHREVADDLERLALEGEVVIVSIQCHVVTVTLFSILLSKCFNVIFQTPQ